MKFNNSLVHLTSSFYEGQLNILFSYDFDNDKIIVESVIGNYEILENIDLNYVLRYAMLDKNYNAYVYGDNKFDEFNFSMDLFYKMTHIDRNQLTCPLYEKDENKKFSFRKLIRK